MATTRIGRRLQLKMVSRFWVWSKCVSTLRFRTIVISSQSNDMNIVGIERCTVYHWWNDRCRIIVSIRICGVKKDDGEWCINVSKILAEIMIIRNIYLSWDPLSAWTFSYSSCCRQYREGLGLRCGQYAVNDAKRINFLLIDLVNIQRNCKDEFGSYPITVCRTSMPDAFHTFSCNW